MKKSFIVLLFLFSVLIVRADEGKWLLSLLNKILQPCKIWDVNYRQKIFIR